MIAVNYNFLDKKISDFLKDKKTATVERVIDGDTIVTTSNEHVRMLGINAPETSSKEKYSGEAKQFLTNTINNKTVNLEISGKDLYNRTLAYIFLGDKNINKNMVENGFANFYFPEGRDEYYNEFKKAWSKCLDSNKNLCEKSSDKCANCIELGGLDYRSQEIFLYNNCIFSCNLQGWWIKDEGRKEFVFQNFMLASNQNVTIKVGNRTSNSTVLYWNGYDYVWTKTGDTLFLRDNQSKLVLWKNY